MPLSNERLTDIADKLFWDEQVDRAALAAWLAGNGSLPDGLEKTRVYVRLLSTVRWYELLDLLRPNQWGEVFANETLARLFPPGLRRQYQYVQRALLG